MIQDLLSVPGAIKGYPSWQVRMLVTLIGLALCSWGAMKARNRTVLVPTLTLLLSIGVGIIVFGIYPSMFDSVSYFLGIYYPPIFYVLIALIALLLVVLHLSMRLSITDERCRKLSQEVALLQAAHVVQTSFSYQEDQLTSSPELTSAQPHSSRRLPTATTTTS